MKKITYLSLKSGMAFAFIMVLVMCAGFKCDDKTPTIVKTFNLDEPGFLDVETSGGWIHVEGIEGNQVEVRAFIKKNGRLLSPNDPLVDELLDGFDFSIDKNRETIHAYAKRREHRMPWKQVSISFYVQVPHDMSCHLRTSGGGINLSGVNGVQNMNTSGGGIKLADINGNTDARTSGGPINIINLEGKANVQTSGGGIRMTDIKGDIEASTSGGPIHLENIYGDVDCHTSGGGIRITGDANYIKATTSGGGIHVDITGLSKELYLSTSGGGIHSSIPSGLGLDLDLKGNRVNAELENFSGSMKESRTIGSMNGGGIPVYMHTSGGNVDINFQ